MVSRNSFGQIYEDDGNHLFSMNVSRAADDSSKITTIIYKDGPVYVVVLKDGKVQSFSVDGRPVAADDLGRYQSVMDEIKVRIREAEEQAVRDRAQAAIDRQQAQRDREQAEKDRHQADLDREQSERDRQQSLVERDQEEKNREQAEKNREQAERDRQQANLDRQQAERDREQAQRDRVRAEEDRKMLDSLMKDLVADGVITDRDSVHSLEVNADGVIVNGKHLPEALEKKYIARYVTRGLSMSYHNNE